jgi:hypothetical protein
VLPITATVSAGSDADLLAGELDIHEAPHADETRSTSTRGRNTPAGLAGGLAVLAIVLLGGRA